MPLNGHGHGCRIHAVRPVANPAASTTRPKREDLPEGVKHQGQMVGIEMPGQHLGIGVRHLTRQPTLEAFMGVPPRLSVVLSQPLTDPCECGHANAFPGHDPAAASGREEGMLAHVEGRKSPMGSESTGAGRTHPGLRPPLPRGEQKKIPSSEGWPVGPGWVAPLPNGTSEFCESLFMGIASLPGRPSPLRHFRCQPESRLHAVRTGFVMAGNIKRRTVVG